MTGINLLHVEIERLFGAQFVRAKFKSSHCRLLLHRPGLAIYWLKHFSQMAWINKRPTTSIAAQVTPCPALLHAQNPSTGCGGRSRVLPPWAKPPAKLSQIFVTEISKQLLREHERLVELCLS
jgi:hypothetical protein